MQRECCFLQAEVMMRSGLFIMALIAFMLVFNASGFVCASTDEGFDVFVRMLQNQGENPHIIKSGLFDFVVTIRRSALSDLEFKAEAERYEKMFREDLKDDPHLELMIADIPARINRKYGGEKKMRGKALLRGNLGEGDSKRLFEIAYLDNANGTWGEPIVIIREDHFGKPNVNVNWEPSASLAALSANPFTLANFHCFGRIQGTPAALATFSLLDPNNRDTFLFSEKNIEDLRISLNKLDQVSGNSILKIAGNTTYDEGATVLILETKMNGKIFQRYWVDRSRGYTVPLIQYYDNDGRLVEEYKSSGYIQHDRTGLWYPTVHVEIKYDSQTGKMAEQREFQIDPSTLQLNHSVSEGEFAIDIPEGANVLDHRNPKSEVRYIATEKGALSLAKGGLDLDKMSWLVRDESAASFQPSPSIGIVPRFALMSVGVLMVLIALYQIWRNRRAKNK